MRKGEIYDILSKLYNREITTEEAFKLLKDLPFKDLSFVKIDFHRELRKGIPETILCLGKSPQQVIKIFKEMKGKTNIIATKASKEIMDIVSCEFPDAEIYEDAGIIFLGKYPKKRKGRVVILTAGTSDIPIAMESVIVLNAIGITTDPIFDVGVAGVHRLINFKDRIQKADVIIVVAGMDGVLPSVVAGLFGLPVIAVPTSIGYGAHFQGIAPLLTMLNSCAPGVVVVNINNGYGAGYFASLIVNKS